MIKFLEILNNLTSVNGSESILVQTVPFSQPHWLNAHVHDSSSRLCGEHTPSVGKSEVRPRLPPLMNGDSNKQHSFSWQWLFNLHGFTENATLKFEKKIKLCQKECLHINHRVYLNADKKRQKTKNGKHWQFHFCFNLEYSVQIV